MYNAPRPARPWAHSRFAAEGRSPHWQAPGSGDLESLTAAGFVDAAVGVGSARATPRGTHVARGKGRAGGKEGCLTGHLRAHTHGVALGALSCRRPRPLLRAARGPC